MPSTDTSVNLVQAVSVVLSWLVVDWVVVVVVVVVYVFAFVVVFFLSLALPYLIFALFLALS